MVTIEAIPISFAYNRIWVRLWAEEAEQVWGAGEQYSYLNLRGRDYPIWTREQGEPPSVFSVWQDLILKLPLQYKCQKALLHSKGSSTAPTLLSRGFTIFKRPHCLQEGSTKYFPKTLIPHSHYFRKVLVEVLWVLKDVFMVLVAD